MDDKHSMDKQMKNVIVDTSSSETVYDANLGKVMVCNCNTTGVSCKEHHGKTMNKLQKQKDKYKIVIDEMTDLLNYKMKMTGVSKSEIEIYERLKYLKQKYNIKDEY